MIDPVTISSVAVAYEIAKYWLPILGAMFGLFKLVEWVKKSFGDIKDHVQDLNTNTGSLTVKIEEQTKDLVKAFGKHTKAVVGEVKQLRSDFSTVYAPAIATQNQLSLKPVHVAQRAKKGIPPKAKKKLK